MSMTGEQRRAQLRLAATDDDVTFKELLVYSYHWLCYEWHLHAEYRAEGRMIKHGRALNHLSERFQFRQELKNL